MHFSVLAGKSCRSVATVQLISLCTNILYSQITNDILTRLCTLNEREKKIIMSILLSISHNNKLINITDRVL